MKIFVSYSHRQGDWVWNRLVPLLKAGGAEVLIDRERFVAGIDVVGQMDVTQASANKHLLVLSPEYLASPMCCHEMKHALGCDPGFTRGVVIPVLQSDLSLPARLRKPLYVDLRDDEAAEPWDLLLRACDVRLGCTAPRWLRARDMVVRSIDRYKSVNLVTGRGTAWRSLLQHIQQEHIGDLGIVDLQRPATASRRGLIATLLEATGAPTKVPPEPEDLVTLDHALTRRPVSRIALTHFHLVQHRPQYGPDLFHTLRYMVMEARKLVLVVQSEGKGFPELLPIDHPLSELDLETISLDIHP